MKSTNIHPQVLLNISQQVLIHDLRLPQQPIQIGLLLGYFNSQQNMTEIVDSFEGLYYQKELLDRKEIEFLQERMELRLRGDKWNLFKNLDIVGWYITDKTPFNYSKLHQQIANIIDQAQQETQNSLCKYILCFDKSQPISCLFELDSEGQFVQVEQIIEPQVEEMICITSAFQQGQDKGNKYENRLKQQKGTLRFMEELLLKLGQSLDDVQVQNNPQLLRKINELLISFPHLDDKDIQENYSKLLMVSYYCALLRSSQKTKGLIC